MSGLVKKSLRMTKRILTVKWQELFPILQTMHRQCGRSRRDLFFDMYRCYRRYGFIWSNFAIYGFQFIRDDAIRRTFLSSREQTLAYNTLYPPKAKLILSDKALTLKQFSAYVHRNFLDLRGASAEDFKNFLHRSRAERFFAKPPTGMGGHGIETFRPEDIKDEAELYTRLKRDGLTLLEEGIRQHPLMNRLSSHSVNTMRIVTAKPVQGEPRVVACALRVNLGDTFIDNQSRNKGSMGGAASLDKNGVIAGPLLVLYPAFAPYDTHPVTGFTYPGFRVPFFTEATIACTEMAKLLPEARLIGFDMAITPEGPEIVEANADPGPDLIQSYWSLPKEYHGKGLRRFFIEALGDETIFDHPSLIKRRD